MEVLGSSAGCMGAVSSELALISSLRTQDSLESEGLEEQGSKATSTTLRTQSAQGLLAGAADQSSAG